MDKRTILNIAQKYINIVSEKYIIEKAFLFGSFAKRKEKKHSDIDIAIVLMNISDFFKVQLDLMKLRRRVDLRIEPHLFSIEDFNETNPLASKIMKTGVELKIKSTTAQQSA
ncbi:MAG TPA: nucleotidyltransferase domain-containing protein [Candidatus Moranbacteria bacterium]|nr:nucleotidyltransferase domain protein [bacterium BMS3Bbin03]HDZ85926.1 nucleotidyltransferase domain-containing protein [Candidatus Moranbacteria bacterium]